MPCAPFVCTRPNKPVLSAASPYDYLLAPLRRQTGKPLGAAVLDTVFRPGNRAGQRAVPLVLLTAASGVELAACLRTATRLEKVRDS